VVELRDEPLGDAALDLLRRLAAAGGPFVQRVLRLSDDRRTIWYEALPGTPLPLPALTAPERARLAPALAALPPGAVRSFARTAAGPVLLVAPGPARA
jgi:hypothetical protein